MPGVRRQSAVLRKNTESHEPLWNVFTNHNSEQHRWLQSENKKSKKEKKKEEEENNDSIAVVEESTTTSNHTEVMPSLEKTNKLLDTKYSAKQISVMTSLGILFTVILFYCCRKIRQLRNPHGGVKQGRGGDRNIENIISWGDDYEYATVAAEYDELLEDTFINDEFTQEGDSDGDESIASILSEWSGDGDKYRQIEMTELDSDKLSLGEING